jgi:uncharacterized protein YndB with AHSA1/START domain
MKWVLIVGIVIAALIVVVGIVALIGSRLPQSHVASREARVPAQADAVWQAVTDVERYGMWRKDVSRIERLPDREGKVTWVEHARGDRITFVVDRAEPPRLLVVRIADPELPFGGTWTYEISPDGSGSRLKITEHGEVYNPIFRFMARFVFGYEGTIAAYLSALEQKFASGAADRAAASR